MSEFNAKEFLHTLDTLPLENTDTNKAVAKGLKEELKAYIDSARQADEAVQARVLADTRNVAMSSPYADVEDPNAANIHPSTPGQEVSLYAVRMVSRISRDFPSQAEDAITSLETILRSARDYEIRYQAAKCLQGQANEPNLSQAFAALNTQRHENTHSDIRDLAEDGAAALSRVAPGKGVRLPAFKPRVKM